MGVTSVRVFVPLVLVLWSFYFAQASPCWSQAANGGLTDTRSAAPRIYIDCPDCDLDFIKTEMKFANYVRDRKEAEVHVLITSQETAGGGREYTLTFMGQERYAGLDDTLRFYSRPSDTEDDVRKGITQFLKLGLTRYVARTALAGQMSVSIAQQMEPTAVVDKWRSWVFSLSLNSSFNGEKTHSYLWAHWSTSARRVTPAWKINLSLRGTYNDSKYTMEDRTVSSFSRSRSLSGLVVRSVDEHWSLGASGSAWSSTYSNVGLGLAIGPAVEYNLFPYSESTRRQFRFLYDLEGSLRRYHEETIFEKTSEMLIDQSLSLSLELQQPWGSVNTALEGSHYLHDLSKNRLELSGDLDLRLFKGFSFTSSGSYSLIHDQLSLRRRGAAEEEILLEQRQMATQYDYYGSIGLKYTFGSVYSNVVNPRFGN